MQSRACVRDVASRATMTNVMTNRSPEGVSSLQKPSYSMAPPVEMAPPLRNLKPASTTLSGWMEPPLGGISSVNLGHGFKMVGVVVVVEVKRTRSTS